MSTRLEHADNCIIVDDVIYPKGLLRACIDDGMLTVWEDLERTIPLVNSVHFSDIVYVNFTREFVSEAELREFVKTHFFLQTSGGGSGSVTSVGISSTDLSVSGSPITSGGSITLNVNNDAITYAKMQNMASGKLLGRYSSGSGNIQELTISSGLDLDSSGNLTATGGSIKIDSGSYTPTITNVSGVDAASSSVIGNFFWKQTGEIVDIDGYIETIASSSPPEVANRSFRLSPHDTLTFSNAADATGFGVTNLINSTDKAGAFITANPTHNDLLVSFSSDAADSRLFKVHATYTLTPAPSAPMLLSGVVSNSDKDRIALHFDQGINASLTATNGSFTITGDIGTYSVTGRTITGAYLYLDLDAEIVADETVSVSYMAGANALEGTNGVQVVDFVEFAITNNVASGGGEFPTEAILLMIHGQSQAVGRAASDPSNEITASADCWEYKLSTNEITHLEDPTGDGDALATDRSIAPPLANALNELTGKPIIIVKAGKGNTEIAQFIDPMNQIYTDAVDRWHGLMDFCTANAITIDGAYMYWEQGGNDAGYKEIGEYMALENQFVNMVKEEMPEMEHIFTTRNGYDISWTSDANCEKIMEAKNRIALSRDEITNASLLPPTFNGTDKVEGDGVHWSVKGFNQLAADAAEAIDYLRTNNSKKQFSEPVAALQPSADDFDDVYVFRSFIPGENRANYDELYGRNDLVKSGSGTAIFDDVNGLDIVSGSINLQPTLVRTLTNTEDWTVEVTFSMSSAEGMLINGDRGSWNEDWLYVDSPSSIYLRGNSANKIIALTGVDFSQPTNLALVYTESDTTLRVYVNGGIKATVTDWSFTEWKIQTFLRGYTAIPGILFEGNVQRIRVMNRALNTYEFDSTFLNQVVPVVDLEFTFNNTIDETNNSIVTGFYDVFNDPASPTYSDDVLVLNADGYVRLGHAIVLGNDWTIEWAGTRTDDTTEDYLIGDQSAPLSGGNTKRITWTDRFIQVDAGSGSQLFDLDPVDTKAEHVYKIEYDKTAGTLKLYVDASLKETKTSVILPNNITAYIIGAGHVTTAYSYKGTLKNFRIKNFIA